MHSDAAQLEGPRGTATGERPALIELVNAIFRRPTHDDMLERFPVLFGDANRENCRIFVDGTRPVAHVGFTVQDVADFRDHLRDVRHQAVATINRALVSIRRFCQQQGE